ncbi:transmembrane signal receptor [Lithospermum erythrorhizon]|uniref:Transmembrane signal receptor n=1 Tax=Lithospermum erythrorhizon TaxID=34254 RepID=A0AAV3RL10_LITER
MGLNYLLQAPITIFVSLLIIFSSTICGSNLLIAKPHCQDTCGNFTIPFPFGIKKNCYLSQEFKVTCNKDNILLLGEIPVLDISLEGQLWINKVISSICFRRDGSIQANAGDQEFRMSTNSFSFNNFSNVFVVVGCDSYAYFTSFRFGKQQTFSTGCISFCRSKEEISNDGFCSGAGCCQAKIPSGISDLNTSLYNLNNYRYIEGIKNCIYAFIVGEKSFNFSIDRITKPWNSNRLPAVLDWAIVDNNCGTAQASKDYACKGNTFCQDKDYPKGYLCHCKQGYQGNPYLDGPGGCKDINECEGSNLCKKNSVCQNKIGNYTCKCSHGYKGDGFLEGCKRDEQIFYKLIAGSSVATLVIILATTWLYFIIKKRKSIQRKEMMRDKFFKENGGVLLKERFSKQEGDKRAKIYHENELERATDNFAQSRILGQGRYGKVFKGYLKAVKGMSDNEQQEIAVKKSKQMDRSGQMETFANEVFVLSQINHKNVVRLLGCCLDTESPLLVYEFIDNGTLSDHIHDSIKASFLSLQIRLRIATETAEVLSYLHSAASPPLIHRDIKSANILLDKNYTAKVADFGVSRLFPLDETQVSTVILGTFGYLDPEYMHTGKLTVKSDVYSFGVLLMEIMTGKKVVYFDLQGEERRLAKHFLSCLNENRMSEILDANLLHQKETYGLIIEAALVAKSYVSIRGDDRPSMREVATKLRGLSDEMKQMNFQAKPYGSSKMESILLEPSMGHAFDGISISIDGPGMSSMSRVLDN